MKQPFSSKSPDHSTLVTMVLAEEGTVPLIIGFSPTLGAVTVTYTFETDPAACASTNGVISSRMPVNRFNSFFIGFFDII